MSTFPVFFTKNGLSPDSGVVEGGGGYQIPEEGRESMKWSLQRMETSNN